jgi:hypothetical protein
MSRFLDERGRIFGKVNVVDILVLLVIIAVVAFAVTRMTGSTATTVAVRVTYTAKAVRQVAIPTLQTGAVVRDDGGTVLGKVAAPLSVSPTLEEFLTPEGELKAFDSPVFSDVDIVVTGEARVSGANVRIGSTLLAKNEKVILLVGDNKLQTEITSVERGAGAVK